MISSPDILAIPAAFMLLSSGAACPSHHGPEVRVRPVLHKTRIDRTLDEDALRAMASDSVLPRQMRNLNHLETGGMMVSDIEVRYAVDFKAANLPGGNLCLAIRAIDVGMHVRPRIFISSAFDEHSCFYRAILEHEQSHVDMDRITVEKYAGRVRDGLTLAFGTKDAGIAGPVRERDAEKLKAVAGKNIMRTSDIILKDMDRDRMERQAQVDNAHSYAYIMNACNEDKPAVRIAPGEMEKNE